MERFAEVKDKVVETVLAVAKTPFDPEVRFAAVYIVATIALAVVIWFARGRPKNLYSWLLPREVFLHRSNIVDVKLFLANRALAASGALGGLVFTPVVAYFIVRLLSDKGEVTASPHDGVQTAVIATIIVVLSNDFCKYWAHRLHHKWMVLWPFHAVHHSAEVLTPLTLIRAHPVETAVRMFVTSVLVGVTQGVFIVLVAGEVTPLTIGGANAGYVLFNALGANLRHSHIWLSYGRVLEHVLISPAQHQIHHSSAPEHHDKNFGSIFAIWDWAFGTLYIPAKREDLVFGIADGNGGRIDQPHPTLSAALLKPFRQSWRVLHPRAKPASSASRQSQTPAE